jgi:hypothetical protein
MTLVCMAVTLAGCIRTPPAADMRNAISARGPASVTVPFTLDDNRMFVDVAFAKADGGLRKTRAFVNMGSGAFVLSNALYRELRADERPLHLQIGALDIAIDKRAVQPESMANSFTVVLNPFRHETSAAEAAKEPGGELASFSAPMQVEAVIPPGLLQHFEPVFDYAARTITLSRPGALPCDGTGIPIRVNPRTGFATIDLTVAGKTIAAVLDNGGSYSAFDSATVSDWVGAHPQWLRSVGTMGESNFTMSGDIDVGAQVARLSQARLGPLQLPEIGVVAAAAPGLLGRIVGHVFWSTYSDKAGEEVHGWIGGNVFKAFRVTLDYEKRMSYWHQEAALDTHELDQVGITLRREGSRAFVAGIVQKEGKDTVTGLLPGDEILRIDGREVSRLTRGELLDSLHGVAGDHRHLVVERDGKTLDVDAPITAF